MMAEADSAHLRTPDELRAVLETVTAWPAREQLKFALGDRVYRALVRHLREAAGLGTGGE